MISSIVDKVGLLFDNLSIPGEIVSVFTMFSDIWYCIPYAVRVALAGCFTFACVLVAVRMLF